MAKLFKLLLAAVAASLAVACSTQELDGVNERLNDLESRVSALEKLCKEMNSNISSLQGIVTAMQSGDYITSVTPITSGDKTIGYTITFAKGQPITIYHGEDGADGKDGANGKDGKDGKDGANGQDGKDGADGHTPVIGVKQDTDGIWYWTLDGQWLLDDNGQKIKAVGVDGKDGADGKDGQNGKDGEKGKDGQDGTPGKDGENGKDGITPQLKIEDGYWYISYDNGVTWTKLDKAVGADGKDGKDGKDGAIGLTGDSMFTSIDTSDPDYVVFTLLDGTTIKIPTWYAFEQLRTMVNQMNTNIIALQALVSALQNNDYVTSVTPLMEDGKEVGYTISFTKSNPITIYHGKDDANGKDGDKGQDGKDGNDGSTPVIGVKQDTDGIWYWTINGEWLLDGDGNKIKAIGVDGKDGQDGESGKDGEAGKDGQDGTPGKDGENGKDGITPQLKIEDGYWFISYDNGMTWNQLGKAVGENGRDGVDGKDGKDGAIGLTGDSMFTGIDTSDSEYVVFTLIDGTTIKIPTWYAFEQLRTLVNQMNSNIEALQTIVYALQNNDYISSILPIVENGKEIGYIINFTKSGSVTIYHGKDGANGADGKDGTNGQDGADGHTPVVGVKQNTDGIWYWTLDGQWLLDDNGQKIKAVGVDGKDGAEGKDGQNGKDGENGKDGQDGITPQLKIEDGYWYLSYDNGETWTQLGKATGADGKDGVDGQDGKDGVDGKDGDSMFQSVTVTDTEVTFVTSDGQTFVVKRAAAMSIEFDSADLVVMGTNSTRNIHYTITSGVDDITIEALSSADIKVKVNKADAKTGTLTVKTGATIDEYSKVVVLVNNGSQAIMRTLNFEEEAIEVEENTTKEVTDEGGEVSLEFFSNVPCHAVIPEEAQSWISVAPETKGMEKKSITLIIAPSDGYYRQAYIQVIGDPGLVLTYKIVQDGEQVSVPENEIWYKTKSGQSFNLEQNAEYHAKPFNANLISHVYEDGWWKIKCDSPITVIYEYEFQGAQDVCEFYMPDTIEELRQGALCGLGVSRLYIPKNLSTVFAYALRLETGFGDPDRIEEFYGYHVTEDGKCVIVNNKLCGFANRGIKEYSIPEGVQSIVSLVFNRCKELETILFPSTLESIEVEAFQECTNLQGEIYFPESLNSIGYRAFAGVDKVTAFYGNNRVTTPDHHCIIYDYSDNYGIPENWRGPWLGKYVGNEKTYSIPEGILGVEHYTFGESTKLESLTIPESMEYFSALAFTSTFPLKEDYQLKYVYGKGASKNHQGLIDNGQLMFVVPQCPKDYYVSDDVTSIGYECFGDNKNVESVTLSDNVTSMDGYTFAFNKKIRKVVLSANLERINGSNPFLASYNLEEVYFRSYLPPSYSDTAFNESDCTHLTVYVPEETLDLYKKSGWYQYAPYMVGYKYDDIGEWDPDYYISSDYSADGTVTALQQSTAGTGIDLVFMGDAFSDRQIADGTYGTVMQNAMNAFFSEEPYKSMKDRFNVYTVNVVSATEGYEHSGQALSTGHGDGTYVYGNDSKVIEYAKAAIGEERMDDAVVIVMMNEDAYAGTCFMYYPDSGDYGRGLSIAYFPTSSDIDTFNGLVSHEAGGHGFAKLADEYAYESMGTISAEAIANIKTYEPYGWYKNVDFTSDPSQVKWAQFIADDRYASENIGCYEGGLTYWTGVWRPTDASIMRYNTGGFNAPSRYAIWYRIGKLAYGESWEGSYEDFVTYDAVNRTPAAVQRRSAQRRNYVERPLPQLPPPVVVGHSWREELQKK